MQLKVTGVSYQVEEKSLIEDIHLHTREGEFVGLLGPNGSGKSTFLKTIYRVLKPSSGIIFLDQEDVLKTPLKQLFRQLAVVTQEAHGEFEFRVGEVVMMGRYPFKGQFDRETQQDRDIVESVLKKVGMWDYRDQPFPTLSGGEKQRVFIARALAQTPQFLILDEPTNHLDIYYQIEMLYLLKQLQIGVLTALHDLNLAAYYCDYLYLLSQSRVVAEGPPSTVMTPETIYSVYHVWSEVTLHPQTGKLSIVFLPNHHK